MVLKGESIKRGSREGGLKGGKYKDSGSRVVLKEENRRGGGDSRKGGLKRGKHKVRDSREVVLKEGNIN